MIKRNSGFTLIELLVVISIITLVGLALIVNFREGEKQKRVNFSRDTIINAFRAAQNYSLSGKQIPRESFAPTIRGTRCSGTSNVDIPASMYWIELTTANTFAVMAADKCGGVSQIESYKLIGNTRISLVRGLELTNASGTSYPSNLAVSFDPPFAVMKATSTASPVNTNFSSFTSAIIRLEYNDGTKPVTLTIDGISGRID